MPKPQIPSAGRTRASNLSDVGIGVGLAVLLLIASWADAGPPWISDARPIDAWAIGLCGVVGGAVALRRRYPVWVLVALNAVALVWAAAEYPGRLATLTPLIACYALAAARGWRWGICGAAATAVISLVVIRLAFGDAEPAGTSLSAVLVAATASAAGMAVGYYRALLVATRTQLAREVQTREEQARRQAAEERLRIARELHDFFGHTMSTISVQAGVGIHLLQTRPAQAEQALAAIKEVSDQGLSDVKVILGVLRADENPGHTRVPAGGIDQLEELLKPARAAGLEPHLITRGTPRPLPAAVDLAAYRVVQEALTNVLRHADASMVRVVVSYEPERLIIQVRDDGSVDVAGQLNPPGRDDRPRSAEPDEHGGHGIDGMRERVLALSGKFSAGPHPTGGFQVWCTLPTPERAC